MRLFNKTRNTILTDEIIIPESLIDQSLGLLKYHKPITIVLHTRFGIHTFGMRFPIDIVILDKDNRIAEIKKNLKPNRIFIWNIAYSTVIELPTGILNKSNTGKNDEVIIVNK